MLLVGGTFSISCDTAQIVDCNTVVQKLISLNWLEMSFHSSPALSFSGLVCNVVIMIQ